MQSLEPGDLIAASRAIAQMAAHLDPVGAVFPALHVVRQFEKFRVPPDAEDQELPGLFAEQQTQPGTRPVHPLLACMFIDVEHLRDLCMLKTFDLP